MLRRTASPADLQQLPWKWIIHQLPGSDTLVHQFIRRAVERALMVATPTVDLQREGACPDRCSELTDLESDWETWGWVSFFYPSHWVDRCYMGLMPYEVIIYLNE